MLNASARNCTFIRSPMWVFLNSEPSHRCAPGPRPAPRREFPGGPAAFGTLTYADVLNHWSKVCGAPAFGLATWFGRRPAKLLRSNNPSPAGSLREPPVTVRDRKSTRLNSSHLVISYAVFCLKKKKHESRH